MGKSQKLGRGFDRSSNVVNFMRELSDGERDGHRVCVSRATAFFELSCRDECCEPYDTLMELRLNRQRKKFFLQDQIQYVQKKIL